MTNEQSNMLVLKDQAGSYFLVPQATVEQGRVPEEHTAEVEQLIATSGVAGDDVQGHFLAGCGGLTPPTEELPWYVEFVLRHQAALGLR